jgi:hypothetical protein
MALANTNKAQTMSTGAITIRALERHTISPIKGPMKSTIPKRMAPHNMRIRSGIKDI